MPHMTMKHEVDPATDLNKRLGDISKVEIFNNQILVAVYVRPTRTASGLYLTDKTTEEDLYQGKVGLVVKAGPSAFKDESGKWFNDIDVDIGDWVVFRPSDGWAITVNGVLCRLIDDINVRGRIDAPDRVW